MLQQFIKEFKQFPADVFGLIYPNLCQGCGNVLNRGEQTICLRCSFTLPRSNYLHFAENPVAEKFKGKLPVEHASAFLIFSKQGKVQHLIHRLKYGSRTDVAERLGRLYGEDLKEKGLMAQLDFIIPVPLHPKKERQRGFNQSYYFAKGLSEALQVPVDVKTLKRAVNTSTQTKKNLIERWKNVEEAFEIKDATAYAGKHILLVDDVLTTGSTLEACGKAILEKTPSTKISITTLAFAA